MSNSRMSTKKTIRIAVPGMKPNNSNNDRNYSTEYNDETTFEKSHEQLTQPKFTNKLLYGYATKLKDSLCSFNLDKAKKTNSSQPILPFNADLPKKN